MWGVHKTVTMTLGGKEAEIDENIVPIINWLWSRGAETFYCCEGDYDGTPDGEFPYVIWRAEEDTAKEIIETFDKFQDWYIIDHCLSKVYEIKYRKRKSSINFRRCYFHFEKWPGFKRQKWHSKEEYGTDRQEDLRFRLSSGWQNREHMERFIKFLEREGEI